MRSGNFLQRLFVIGRPSYFYLFLSLALIAAVPLGIQQAGLLGPEPAIAYLDTFPSATPGTGGSGSWILEDIFPNYAFNSPIHMQEEPGSNRILVAEKLGRIKAFDKTDPSGTKTTFLDISSDVDASGESGLLCFAFHPLYTSDSPYVYVFYSYMPGGTRFSRLSRFSLDATGLALDPATEMVLIHEEDRASNHNGGPVFFGPDGFLYIAMGDEGGANNSLNNGQSVNSRLYGGLLRIDVDRDPTKSHPILRQSVAGNGSFTANYYIPDTNPWQDPSGNTLEEFVAIGLRNPHRISLDPPTGNIWIGDVGQGQREEVNLFQMGGNYQWGYKEGSLSGPQAQPGTVVGTEISPIYEYSHTSGNNCIVGGYVYRGAQHTDLQGKYLFADNGGKRLWAMELTAGPNPSMVQVDELMTLPFGASYFSISAFATDDAGEIYVIRMNGNASPGGKIYKLNRQNPGAPEPPALLSDANVFQTITPTTLTPEDYMIPYDLNQPFWSDGALKSRWLVVPNDGTHDTPAEKINYTNKGDWDLPPGAVLVKHFEIPLDETNPAVTKRLETRLTIFTENGGHYGVTYKWRDDQSEADLISSSATDTLDVNTAVGTRDVSWYFPSRTECLSCHNEQTEGVLGPRARQLNGDMTYPSTGITANQLKTLTFIEGFDLEPDTNNLGDVLTTVAIDDNAASLEQRAMSYLDANCASCHRPGTGILANFDARLSTPLSQKNLVYGVATTPFNQADGRLVIPGDLEHSILYKRVAAVHETYAMPPLAKGVMDTAGVALIGQWIQSLPDDFVQTCDTVDFESNFVQAYSQAQDAGTFSLASNGKEILVEDNAWKTLSGVYTINAGSFLRFDFRSTTQGEDHSIGFDSDSTPDGNRFQVYGTQTGTGAITDFAYTGGGAWQTFNIPIGTYFTGLFNNLIITADHDGGAQNGNSSVRNLQIYEGSCVFKTDQNIDFPDIPHQMLVTGSVNLGANASSGLPVTYSIVSGPATVAGATVTFTGAGIVKVRAAQAGNGTYEEAPEVDRTFYVTPTAAEAVGTGLAATYYSDKTLTTVYTSQTDANIDFKWGTNAPLTGMPYSDFSVSWEGEIEVPTTGNYTFTTRTDDGVRLWINNTLIIDEWQDQAATDNPGSINMTAWTRVPIRMEFYEGGVYGVAQLRFSSADVDDQVVPQALLYPSGSVLPTAFIELEGRAETRHIGLNWDVAGLEAGTHFDVFHGMDTQSFEAVGEVEWEQGENSFSFNHLKPSPGFNYYKIQAKHLDGSFSTSTIVAVHWEAAEQGWDVRVFPNPVVQSDRLHFEVFHPEPQSFTARLMDPRGKIVWSHEEATPNNRTAMDVQLSSHAAGLYLLIVESEDTRLVKRVLWR